MNKLIYDEGVLRDFFEKVFYFDLDDYDVFFMSLASRNKYLTEEEKSHYTGSAKGMFAKTLVRHRCVEEFVSKIRRFETAPEAYLTSNKLPFPNHALVVYINANPSNMLQAYTEFNKQMGQVTQNLLCKNDNCKGTFKTLDQRFLSCVQKSTTSKRYLDIDCDMDKSEYQTVEGVMKDLDSSVSYHIVETKSGYHILVDKKRSQFSKEVNIDTICKVLTSSLPDGSYKEIQRNQRAMVPVVGTLQGGFPVRILRSNVI